MNRPEALSLLCDRFPPGWKPAASNSVDRVYALIVGGAGPRPNVRRYNILYSNLERLARTTDLDRLLDIFESDVQFFVAQEAKRRVFVHAGVVGWGGQAIVIPGRSLSGKTTLVAELVRAGATYYSDEYAVLDGRGRVHPYARPLGLRGPNGMEKQTVEALGGRRGVKPLPVGLVVVSKYKSGAKWRPKRLSPGEGALELLDNTLCARLQPQRALSTLREIVLDAPVISGVRGEAKQTVESILKILSDVS